MARQVVLVLPDDIADRLRAKVESGLYSNESAVVIDTIERLDDDTDEALEHWLRTEAVGAYDELEANPGSAVSIDEVRKELAELHAEVSKRR